MGSDGQKKKIAIAGFSAILLVAMVVAVTVSVSKSGSSQSGGGASPAGGDGGGITTSTKAIDSLCAPTDYKETCKSSLSSAKNTSNPRELIKVAFNVAEENIAQVIKNSSLLKEAAKDPMTSKALDTCKELLETSIEDLKRSFDSVDHFDVSKMDDYVENLRTWLSAAITYQETCIDGFENTTGDTGEKMKQLLKTSAELSSNGLAMVTDISEIIANLQLGGFNRKLLASTPSISEYSDGVPKFVDSSRRKLLAAGSLKPNAVVAKDGSGKFNTINQAIASIPPKNNVTFVILAKAGVYKENVIIPKKMNKIVLIGEGPTRTRISSSKNYVDGTPTFHTATVAVHGEDFTAMNIGFENTAGASKHQAVALRVSADRGIIVNCAIDGYQDTLYVHTYRQYYRDCTISGTVDFIFGDAAAVFQNCKMVVRKPDANQNCMVTAQGRKDRRGVGAIVLQNCQIVGEPALLALNKKVQTVQVYLGRPWKEYSRTIVMQSYLDALIDPAGWSPWTGTYALDTCYYGEYQNRGPGSNMAKRVTWKGIKKITPQIAESFTPARYFKGDEWIKPAGVPYVSGMIKV